MLKIASSMEMTTTPMIKPIARISAGSSSAVSRLVLRFTS